MPKYIDREELKKIAVNPADYSPIEAKVSSEPIRDPTFEEAFEQAQEEIRNEEFKRGFDYW